MCICIYIYIYIEIYIEILMLHTSLYLYICTCIYSILIRIYTLSCYHELYIITLCNPIPNRSTTTSMTNLIPYASTSLAAHVPHPLFRFRQDIHAQAVHLAPLSHTHSTHRILNPFILNRLAGHQPSLEDMGSSTTCSLIREESEKYVKLEKWYIKCIHSPKLSSSFMMLLTSTHSKKLIITYISGRTTLSPKMQIVLFWLPIKLI